MPTRASSLAALREYRTRIGEAVAQGRHHDQRRQILVELLRDGFGLTVDDVVLEHNVSVAKTRGRIDLLYKSLVWEVKRDLDAERDDLERELTFYLTSLGETALGVGTDGFRFELLRLEGAHLRRINELDLSHSAVTPEQALDWFDSFVFVLDDVAPTTEAILERFGLESAVYAAAANELVELWTLVQDQPEASVKHEEWQRLLEVVYGTRMGTADLWLRHTYLVMVARLLAYLAISHELPQADDTLGVLTGSVFVGLGLENLVERDFFSWPALPETSSKTETLLYGLAHHLGLFRLETLNEDLLKELYETMVDPAERQLLGEFYTPDWLADTVLEHAGFDASTRMLDPSCGSGTFLFAAIRRLRREGLSGAALVDAARRNVVGIDIHPLALATARATYVLALRKDLRESSAALTIPVYMADTLAVPEQGFGRVVEIEVPADDLPPALPKRFQLPTERDPGQTVGVGQIVDLVDELADLARTDQALALQGLASKLQQWGVRSQAQTWEDNLRLLAALRERHLDTIWSFVLTNAARPHEIAADPVDLVVGNPPWLTVMDIAARSYKDRIKRLAQDYGLVGSGPGSMADISHIDTSTVFAAFCNDHFLPLDRGRVAFVLPRSVMAGARQHRRFREGRAAMLYAPHSALDLEHVQPLFRIPACVMIFDKVPREERPPAPWEWSTKALAGQLPRKNASREEADNVLVESDAEVAEGGSPSPYLTDARQGVDIRPRALWLVEPIPGAAVIDRDRPSLRSDAQAVANADARAGWRGVSLTGRVESRYLYATSLRVDPYRMGPLRLAALPIDAAEGGGVTVLTYDEVLSRGDSGMAAWLAEGERLFRQVLAATEREPRGTAIDYLDTQHKLGQQRPKAPRVVWGKGGSYVRAAVVPNDVAEVFGLPVQGFIVDLNQYVLTCSTEDEAHYLCAMLNSEAATEGIRSQQTVGQFGPRDIHRRPLEEVPIPRYDSAAADHRTLVTLSRACHDAAANIDFDSQRRRERYMAELGDSVARVDALARKVLA